jgi:hypothetical protein
MDRLPKELVDKILSCLPKHDLKHLLTLSSKFRYAAERYSGAFSRYDMNECNAEEFLARYSSHRLRYLREVSFRPRLPPVNYRDEPTVPCRESLEDLEKNDASFTRQIELLFATLKATEERAGTQLPSPGRYRLIIFSPLRLVDKGFEQKECLHHHYVSWRIHLIPCGLPEIGSVRSFEIHNHGDIFQIRREHEYGYTSEHRQRFEAVEMKLDLRIIVDLAVKFPNLEFLGCKVGGYEWCTARNEKYEDVQPVKYYEHDWEGPRRDSRHDFAGAVATCISQLPNSLKSACLDFLNPLDNVLDIDHEERQPDLVSPTSKDPFSSSLRMLSNNLRRLQLRVMADDSLFTSDGTTSPPWPNLEILDVMFHIATPNGRWYFHGPGPRRQGASDHATTFEVTEAHYPPHATSELDRRMESLLGKYSYQLSQWNDTTLKFRIAPDDAKLRSLLEGFAKATNAMPALRKAQIWTPLRWNCTEKFLEDGEEEYLDEHVLPMIGDILNDNDELAWGIIFVGPGPSPSGVGSRLEFHPSRQLYWRVSTWRPDAELHSLFQGIAHDRYGEDLLESWTDFERGDFLIGQECFQELFCDENRDLGFDYGL